MSFSGSSRRQSSSVVRRPSPSSSPSSASLPRLPAPTGAERGILIKTLRKVVGGGGDGGIDDD